MGGTEASMAPVLLKQYFSDIDMHIITFGQTRPGGSDFRRLAEKAITFHRRIVNCGDPASGLPRGDGYTHIDDAITLYPIPGDIKMVPYHIDESFGGMGFWGNSMCKFTSSMSSFIQLTHSHNIEKSYWGRLKYICTNAYSRFCVEKTVDLVTPGSSLGSETF